MGADQDRAVPTSGDLSEDELAWMAAGDALATASPDDVDVELVAPQVPSRPPRRPLWIAASAGVAVMGALCLGMLAPRAENHPAVAAALAPSAPMQTTPSPAPHDAVSDNHPSADARLERARPVRKLSPVRVRMGAQAPGGAASTAPRGQRRAQTAPHASSPGPALRR